MHVTCGTTCPGAGQRVQRRRGRQRAMDAAESPPLTAAAPLDERWTDVVKSVVEEYLRTTSLHGYRYLSEPGRHWSERLVWLIVHILAVWGVVLIITDVWREFLSTPTVTTVDSTNFPIWNVPFPAVAVCNLNKISKRTAQEVAKNMSRKTNDTLKESLHLLRLIGRLYDHDTEGHQDFLRLHQVLQKTYGDDYNVTDIMLKLNPSCDQLLVRCMWAGEVRSCSDLFTPRKTMEGYCCAFNYLRHFDDFFNEGEGENYDWSHHDDQGERGRMPGAIMGLSVVVNPEPDDYYYPLISSFGSKMLVFGPHDFPDTPSGGLVEKLVPLRSEVFFRLDATSVVSTEGVRGFPVARRRCLFTSELRNLFAGYYSYSECLMNCRIRSITRLCRCVPYYFPARGDTRECHMMDIECLARYREKWWTLRPTETILGLEAEMESSISCEECLPACADTTYHVQTTAAPLVDPRFARSPLLDNITIKNHSVFHLYYGSFDSMRLKQDVLYYWYELLSNFGGICGLFVGFSLISVVEFVYFFTVRLFLAFQERERRALLQVEAAKSLGLGVGLGLSLGLPHAAATAVAARDPSIARKASYGTNVYWREILPRY